MRWVDSKKSVDRFLEPLFRPLTPPRRQLMKKFERDDLPKLDWLDTLAFRRMEEVRAVCSCLVLSYGGPD